jgi:MFS family permease
MHHHRHHLRYVYLVLKNKELRDLYVAMSLKTLSLSMIGIFIPLFLMIDRNFSLNEVVLFYVWNVIAMMLFTPFAGKFSSKFGLKKSIVLAAPMFIIFYLGLHNFENLGISINYLAILLGISSALYWTPFMTHFIRKSDKKHRSEEVGFLSGVTIMSTMAGPFLGGLIITMYGFNMLFFIVSLLMFLSIFPMLLIKETHEPFKCTLKDLVNLSKKGSFKLMALGGANIAEMVFWPVFLFSTINVYAKMGLVFFVAELSSFFGSFFFGAVENRQRLLRLLKWGAGISVIIWISRIFFEGALLLATVTVIGAFLHSMIEVPFDTLAYDSYKRRKYLSESVIYKLIMMNVGKLIILGVILAFGNLAPSFVMVGLMELLHLF